MRIKRYTICRLSGFQHVENTDYVVLHIFPGILHGRADAGVSGQVDNHINIFCAGGAGFRIGNISDNQVINVRTEN